MRYHNITTDDMNNGNGLRTVLWLAGCDHCCKECQNPVTWDPNGGLAFDKEAKEELFTKLDKDYISGITLSGGDPLYFDNRQDVTELAKEVKEKFPNKTIWLYTGYLYEQVQKEPVMAYIDVLVDGPFEIEQRDTRLHWKGSSNQRVINMIQTRKTGQIVLEDDWRAEDENHQN